MKIGLDFHGVIDSHPEFFAELSRLFGEVGHEVHIITGGRSFDIIPQLKKLNIYYTHLFSITDYLVDQGLEYYERPNGDFMFDPKIWDKTKGEYCRKNNINIHFDDTDHYMLAFTTPFVSLFRRV